MRAQVANSGDVFASGDPSGALMSAVRSLRQDASNGTGAPQLAAAPDYPSSMARWNALKIRYPSDAAAYQPCVDPLLQAFRELKQVGPLMSGKNYAAQVNAGVKRAKAFVSQADDCIAKVSNQGLTATAGKLQQQAQNQTPHQNPGLFGGNARENGGVGKGGYPYNPPKYDPNRKTPKPHAPYTSKTPSEMMMKDCIEEVASTNPGTPNAEVRTICAQVVRTTKMTLAEPDCIVPQGPQTLVPDGNGGTKLCGDLKEAGVITVKAGKDASVKAIFDSKRPYYNGYIDGYGTQPIRITIDITQEGNELRLTRAMSQDTFPNYLEGQLSPVFDQDGRSLVGMKLEITKVGNGAKGQINKEPPGKVANLFPSATRLVQPQWIGY